MSNKNPAPRQPAWPEKDLKFLSKYFPIKDNSWISKKINRKESAIRSMAQRLGLKKEDHYWKKGQIKYLKKWAPIKSYQEIADHIGKTRWACINKYREISG